MKNQIYNEEDAIQNILKAKEQGYKITFSSIENSDASSFTSNYKFIKLENKMNKIIEINTQHEYAIVESGITWEELIAELDKYDYTILSCQSGLNFSIGGSFCGNAHGKKTKTPLVKDTIIDFYFIDGNGNKMFVNNTDSIFNAFAGSLGLLGFITTIKIKICKKYSVTLNVEIIPLNNNSLKHITQLIYDNNVCMINMQCSYFKKIKEIILSTFNYCKYNKKIEELKKNNSKTSAKIFYTLVIILFWILSKFNTFDEFRWNIEKNAVLSSEKNINCINVNNSFDNWTKLTLPNFKIIEFFFPENYFLYCQETLMEIFYKNNMSVLSSGSRIIYERNKTPGFIRFSQYASKMHPYIGLVINFVEDKNKMKKLTNEIREKIIKKNIKMTYHTTYSWNFSIEDMHFMFEDIDNFINLKRELDPDNIFSNKFSEKYILY